MDKLKDKIAKIIDPVAFRPSNVEREGMGPIEREKWLRSRNVALYKAEQIKDAFAARLSEPG